MTAQQFVQNTGQMTADANDLLRNLLTALKAGNPAYVDANGCTRLLLAPSPWSKSGTFGMHPAFLSVMISVRAYIRTRILAARFNFRELYERDLHISWN